MDPSRFLRVHRSVIVRLELVDLLHRSPGGDYEVQLKGGMRLPVSRSRYAALERWLGLSPEPPATVGYDGCRRLPDCGPSTNRATRR